MLKKSRKRWENQKTRVSR